MQKKCHPLAEKSNKYDGNLQTARDYAINGSAIQSMAELADSSAITNYNFV